MFLWQMYVMRQTGERLLHPACACRTHAAAVGKQAATHSLGNGRASVESHTNNTVSSGSRSSTASTCGDMTTRHMTWQHTCGSSLRGRTSTCIYSNG